MQLINYSSNKFEVASDRTEGIPDHAVEIKGDLMEINIQNLNEWGIHSSNVDEILSSGVGIPIRMCNSIDPHECDFNEDHMADVGYVTKMWKDGDWIKARAAITDKTASQKIDDGTWMRGDYGSWSVSGYPGSELDDNNLLNKYLPASISFIIPPNKPAYEGSKFELVAAAVKKNKLQSEHDKNTIGDNMADNDGKDGKTEPKKEVEPKTEEPKTEPKTETTIKNEPSTKEKEEVTMYSQDEFDKKLSESLETQKAEFEEQMAQMTPNGDLESMLSAAKKETITETLDEIKRDKLATEYVEMVTASKVLSAPFMKEGKLDASGLATRGTEIKQLSASVIENMITDGKAMVAAMPAGNTAFDEANVPGKTIDADFNAKVSKLGITSVDFSRGA
jgi:hypothetical protein